MIGTLPNKELFTVKESADHLNVTPKTVYLWISQKKLEAVRLPGKSLRIKKDMLLDAIKPTT